MKLRTPTRCSRWKSLGPAPLVPGSQAYRQGNLQVISAFESGKWHVSVSSLRLGTVSDEALARVRHLWLSALETAS